MKAEIVAQVQGGTDRRSSFITRNITLTAEGRHIFVGFSDETERRPNGTTHRLTGSSFDLTPEQCEDLIRALKSEV